MTIVISMYVFCLVAFWGIALILIFLQRKIMQSYFQENHRYLFIFRNVSFLGNSLKICRLEKKYGK
jgi:hypothetical protein